MGTEAREGAASSFGVGAVVAGGCKKTEEVEASASGAGLGVEESDRGLEELTGGLEKSSTTGSDSTALSTRTLGGGGGGAGSGAAGLRLG